MVTVGRNVLAILAWLLAVGVIVQVFLAGLGVFRNPADFELHRNVGYGLGIVAIVLTVLAFVVRASRLQRGLGLALIVLFVMQSVLVQFRTSVPEIAALHPVTGMLIVALSAVFARATWRLRGLSEL